MYRITVNFFAVALINIGTTREADGLDDSGTIYIASVRCYTHVLYVLYCM